MRVFAAVFVQAYHLYLTENDDFQVSEMMQAQIDAIKLDNPATIASDKSAWETMVTKEEMKGYQLIADKAFNSGIVKDYLIRGIPRFILIDAEGKIIQASAPRPSSGKVAELIDAELAKSTQEALLVR